MNKLGMVLGLAAAATLAGCKDPDYKSARMASQNEAKQIETTPVAGEPVAKKCQCAPGTKHTEPCACGATDCACVVETKPVLTADLSQPAEKPVASRPAEPEYTVYVVQSGDYLAKISKKFNVTISSIKRLNPSIKKDVVWVGQKLKLPGKIDVGVQAAPAAPAVSAAKAPKAAFVAYAGATKDYVVKGGDTLGAIAYGNGITIRQLKEMNGLSSDALKVGQKLKVPAEKVVKAAKTDSAAKPVAAAKPVVKPAEVGAKPAEPVVDAKPSADEKSAVSADEGALAEKKPAEPAVQPAATATYVVQEGDDMTGVSIRWGVSAADIRELNNLAENDQLVPGQIIKLPADAQAQQ